MAVRQRSKQANFLNIGKETEDFVLMGAGFTELNESPAAQTTSKRYINDKSATKSITGYDWSTPFTGDQIRDEKAVEFICNIGEMQLTGTDAESEYIIVDLDKKGTEANTFRARKFKVAIEVAEFGNEDGEMTASGNLLGKGDLVLGTFNTTTKKFTEGFPSLGTLTVTSTASSANIGKTIIAVTPSKESGNSYKYKTGTSVTLPVVNEVITTGYTTWDGTAEISATTGDKILIVEVNSENKAVKAGIATVASKA